MTRRRPGGTVRVLTECARCNAHIAYGLGSREAAYLRVDVAGPLVRHELAVCRDCDAYRHTQPTLMEADALARDASSAVEAMEFAQQWNHDLARVQRTARHFLGADRADAAATRLRAEYLERRDRTDAEWEAYRQRVASRDFVPDFGDNGDDDLPL
ncbi:hypothetical protein J421_4624 (plasmid) [Gemmatirosa kalamazoonensis]|uniref:Uncharacterized protein n=1 Tax=Gemmatirosa kalamazoonensis TaxID=861299 RepID=W0RMT4_9BACT|nr:hypothetical protein [Gemmatirosa kalamazoonensis]AHG92091.1 hypothetical protein J421_4556 [Gemmatirosa kalamazoonensis]AHG92159.1 hypothetical protein J421_4624 [Gemmatirosa kalamazoonensis]